MDPFFRNRVYAVTGGASGIGLATVKQLLRYGAKVSVADLTMDADALTQELSAIVAETHQGKADETFFLRNLSVSSHDAVESWIADTVAKFGRLDGAANIAGASTGSPADGTIEKIRDEDWERVMGVNGYGVMNSLRAEMKYLGKYDETGVGRSDAWRSQIARGTASVVNAGSGMSVTGRPGVSVYAASKHAVLGITRCVAKEVGKKGIRVNCIAIGSTDTPLIRRTIGDAQVSDKKWVMDTALERWAAPEEMADTIVYLLSDRSSYMTGACIYVDGGRNC